MFSKTNKCSIIFSASNSSYVQRLAVNVHSFPMPMYHRVILGPIPTRLSPSQAKETKRNFKYGLFALVRFENHEKKLCVIRNSNHRSLAIFFLDGLPCKIVVDKHAHLQQQWTSCVI